MLRAPDRQSIEPSGDLIWIFLLDRNISGVHAHGIVTKSLKFKTIRLLCRNCGWFRNLAQSGFAEGKRALVSLSQSGDPSHILKAKVLEVPIGQPLDEVFNEHPEYRDLDSEAHRKGWKVLIKEFQPMLAGQACPRCKLVDKLELGQI